MSLQMVPGERLSPRPAESKSNRAGVGEKVERQGAHACEEHFALFIFLKSMKNWGFSPRGSLSRFSGCNASGTKGGITHPDIPGIEPANVADDNPPIQEPGRGRVSQEDKPPVPGEGSS